MARQGVVRVTTTERITCTPNMWNVVSGRSGRPWTCGDEQSHWIAAGLARIQAAAARLSAASGAVIDIRERSAVAPVQMDGHLAGRLTAAARQLSLTALPLSSGAGHDAQLMARIAPDGDVIPEGRTRRPDRQGLAAGGRRGCGCRARPYRYWLIGQLAW